MSINRRSFVLGGGGVVAAKAAEPQPVTIGLIGSGGRGIFLVNKLKAEAGARVAAVCDVYEPNLEAGLSAAGPGTTAYRNYKALLDDRSLTAVVIATPEHWHHRMLLDALAAGKDVYVEKPLCQTPEQGLELIEAVNRSKSVVQVGMQRRSYALYRKAHEVVAGGTAGKIRMVRSWWLNNDLGRAPRTKLDGPLDWEQWQGPAPRRPLDADRFANWRFYSEYSGGRAADQGAHMFDAIHMLMDAGYPLSVTAGANRIQKPKIDTPETVSVSVQYPQDFLAVFLLNYAAMRYRLKNDQLIQLDGDLARVDVGREEFAVYRQGQEEKAAIREVSQGGFDEAATTHVRNFLECVRTRATPTGTVELGFQACLVMQLANLSLKQGRTIRWDAAQKKVV